MKKRTKIWMALLIFVAMLQAVVATVSASTGTTGIQLHWAWLILCIPGVVLLIKGYLSDKAKAAPFLAIGAVLVIVGAVLAVMNVGIESISAPEEAEIVTAVDWDVSATCSDGTVTVNNNSRTISMMIFANTTANTLKKRDNSTAFADPTIAFRCRPKKDVATDFDTDKGATSKVHITDPGKVCDGGASHLFTRASGQVGANLPWTADGITNYETNYITVQYGSSENANLTLNFNDAGIGNSNALDGDEYIWYMEVCGATWTGSIQIVDAYA